MSLSTWTKRYVQDVTDGVLLREMYDFAKENAEEALIFAKQSEEYPEDAAAYRTDYVQNTRAMGYIVARMKELGINYDNPA